MRRRAVVVHRPTEYDELMDRYSTRGQVEFVLRSRGRTLEAVERAHEAHVSALARVRAGIPRGWASADVERDSLSRFLFAPEDVIVVVGPDGLVANTAKYVADQIVIGVDSMPGSNAGVLVRCTPDQGAAVCRRLDEGEPVGVDHLTMVRATVDDSRSLTALNEVFIGHPGHQSARYELALPRRAERQSSSGVVVSTGTGATGWGASLKRGRPMGDLPGPTSQSLAWFVREAWPSPCTGTECTEGILGEGEELGLSVASESLVLFGDGMEADRLVLTWGQTVRVRRAPRSLALVDPAAHEGEV